MRMLPNLAARNDYSQLNSPNRGRIATSTKSAVSSYTEIVDCEEESVACDTATSFSLRMSGGSFQLQLREPSWLRCRYSKFDVGSPNGKFALFIVHFRVWRFHSTISANRKQLEEVSEHLPGPFGSER
jgi:hypothetical protein